MILRKPFCFKLTFISVLFCSFFLWGGLISSTGQDLASESFRLFIPELEVFGPLSSTEFTQLKREHITRIFTQRAADVNLFDDSALFPNLSEVSLNSSNNEHHIEALSRNHTRLEFFTVEQTTPLSENSMAALAAFTKVILLQISFPVANVPLFGRTVPKNILLLMLENTGVPFSNMLFEIKFPAMTRLNLYKETVSDKFFAALEAPHLKEIYFSRDKLTPNALSCLTKFKSLRKVVIYSTKYDSSEIDLLKAKMPKLNVTVLE